MSLEEGRRLWEEHEIGPFPPRLRGEEIEGVDMVLLDADIAGCVQTWLSNNGRLDEWRRGVLRMCLADLDRVLPPLKAADERAYYERLRRLAQLAQA